MHLTPKETVEEVTWPSWKIWVSSCSDSTFCTPPIPPQPCAFWWILRVPSHSVLQSIKEVRGYREMRCVGGSCLSVCGLQDHAIVTPQPCCFHMWGLQRLYVPIPDVGEVTIQTERKRAVWSSHLFIIHYWAWSRSLRGGVPGWRRVSSRRWFVWVSERNELFEHFQGNDVRQKLRDRLGDLCELWLRLGQPLEAFSPGQPSIWRPQGFYCQQML